MDLNEFLPSLDLLASSGVVLSTHMRTVLQTSLILLKNAEKFDTVRFFGKLQGSRQDYYIAQGLGSNHILDKKSFLSVDGVTWAQLPALHPVLMATALRIKGRLVGTPSHEYIVQEPSTPANSSVPPEVQALRKEERRDDGSAVYTTTITEEKRLSALVSAIDSDGAVVPRGAYHKTPTGQIEINPSFEGLSAADAKKMHSYFHFRQPIVLPKKSVAETLNLEKSLDFLDPISEDIPEGSWSLQIERGSSVMILRSLLWPGLVAFHAPNTRKFGYCYVGAATKNLDLAFMLP